MQTLSLAIGKRGRGEDTDHESLREVRFLENQAGARMFSPFQSPSPSPSIGWGISHALRNAVCRHEWSLSTCATPRGSSPRWLALLRAAPGPTSGTGRCLYKVRLAIFRHHICVLGPAPIFVLPRALIGGLTNLWLWAPSYCAHIKRVEVEACMLRFIVT
jgi:hypothetical protein